MKRAILLFFVMAFSAFAPLGAKAYDLVTVKERAKVYNAPNGYTVATIAKLGTRLQADAFDGAYYHVYQGAPKPGYIRSASVVVVSAAEIVSAVDGVIYLSNYPDLQTAVNLLPQGGTIIVGAGVHEIGDVVINQNNDWQKVVTIQGVSNGHLGQAPPLGSGQWDFLLDSGYHYGTILRGTLDATTTGARLYLRDLSMIGHGSGVAVDVGNTTDQFPDALGLEHVSFGNYDTAVRVRNGYYMTLSDISMAGCGTCLDIRGNVIHISDVDIKSCTTGADLGGAVISFEDGAVQGCTTGVIFGVTTGELGDIYFEQLTTSINLTGDGNSITPNFYSSNSGQFLISGKNNDITLGLNPDMPIELTEDSWFNYLRGSAYSTINDAGFKNRYERLYP